MASEYQQTTDKEIQDRVRLKYKASLDRLKALNFTELCFFSETVKALGLSNGLFGLLGVIPAVSNEVAKIGSDLSVNLFFLLLISREYDTYVSPFGLGVKFYTSFTDGTCVITANFESPTINDDGQKLYKFAQRSSIEAAWDHHRTWVSNLTASGKQRSYHLSFDDFTKLARKEDSYMLKPKFTSQAMFGDVGSMLIGGIIFGCLFAAVILILLFWPSLARTLNPACWFVRDIGKVPLLPGLLIMFAGIVISWFLARIQKSTHLFELDIGTMMYGHTPLPDARGFISTKWLVILRLPILPVWSYQIVEEVSNSGIQKRQSLRPLDQLHWVQVRETLWKFKWWYTVIVLAWIGWGVWTLSQCM